MSDFVEGGSGVAALNQQYRPLSFAQRIERLYRDFDPGTVMVTSSFAATSAYFLHIISRIRPEQTIFFIDTGFHFPETLSYKDYLIKLYGLTVRDVRPEAIVAVACERDLSSGLVDTYPIPIIGIPNDRPFGPCLNTQVDLDKVREAIQFFSGNAGSK